MKKILLGISVLLCVLVLYSCDDVIDADRNIKITRVEYNKVLGDQVNSVIMPLAKGNCWVYHVFKYENGKLIGEFYDSIWVSREVLINNEVWFEVFHPFIDHQNYVLLTNTDKGLWMKCHYCDSISNLEAQYPVVKTPYLSGTTPVKFTGLKDGIPTLIYDTLYKYGDWKQSGIFVNGGKAYEYGTWYDMAKNVALTGTKTDTYVVNLGLIGGTVYNNDKSIYSTYNLVRCKLWENGALIKKFDQNIFVFDFGDVKLGNWKEASIALFTNNSNATVTIQGINYISNPGGFTLDGPIMPTVIGPGQSMMLKIKFMPTSIGEHLGKFSINTTAGGFELQVKGRAVN